MIAAAALRLRGAIWYQGNQRRKRLIYGLQMKTMINNWRHI